MKKYLYTLCILSILSFGMVAAEEEDSEEPGTTEDPRIVTETYALAPNANVSRKTNFTLLDESESKKMILELWVEKKAQVKPESERRRRLNEEEGTGHGGMVYQLNGAMYMINQDVFAQDQLGKVQYQIHIGMHDAKLEKDQTYKQTEVDDDTGEQSQVDRTKKVAPRDWVLLLFDLKNQYDQQGTWQCIDGYSDYSKAKHSLDTQVMNGVDAQNDCKPLLATDNDKTFIGNSRLTTKTQFYRLFKTTDTSDQDIEIIPGQALAFQVKVVDERRKDLVNPQFLEKFTYKIPHLESEHSTAEITIIVMALLVASLTIILTVRYIELRGEEIAK